MDRKAAQLCSSGSSLKTVVWSSSTFVAPAIVSAVVRVWPVLWCEVAGSGAVRMMKKSKAKSSAVVPLLPNDADSGQSSNGPRNGPGIPLDSYQAAADVRADELALSPAAENSVHWDMCFVFKVGRAGKMITVKVTEQVLTDAEGKTDAERSPNKRRAESFMRTLINRKQRTETVDEAEHFRNATEATIASLLRAGLQVCCFYSSTQEHIFCLVGATEQRLKAAADRTNYMLALNADGVIDAAGKQNPPMALWLRLKSERVEDSVINTSLFEGLYGKYDEKVQQQFPGLYCQYQTTATACSIFRNVDRLKILRGIVEAEARHGGADLTISLTGLAQHPLDAVFPLHGALAGQLDLAWKHPLAMFRQPLPLIREYFGEAVGFYFAFSELYNQWLLPISLLGAIGFVVQFSTGQVDHSYNAFFALFIAVWTTALLEIWKRRQAKKRLDWGMYKFDQQEQPRAQFQGDWRPSTVNGQVEMYFDPHLGLQRRIQSQITILTIMMAVIAMVVGLFLFRNFLLRWSKEYGGVMSGMLNSFQIQLLNAIYGKIALRLNDYENHKKQSEYQDALIAKSFLFKFVNSYNSLFYIAFFKRFDLTVDGCDDQDPTCMRELQTQLASVFVTALVCGNMAEMAMPWWQRRGISAKMAAAERVGRVLSPAEQEYYRTEYESTFSDFDEQVIQYGYVTLFAVAFPLTPLLALVSNWFEARLDGTKLVNYMRRPHPQGASSIGTWFDILDFMSLAAVVSNAALVFFVSNSAVAFTGGELWRCILYFIIFEHGVLALKWLLQSLIPDMSLADKNREERLHYIEKQIIEGTEEDLADKNEVSGVKVRLPKLEALRFAENDPKVQKIFANSMQEAQARELSFSAAAALSANESLKSQQHQLYYEHLLHAQETLPPQDSPDDSQPDDDILPPSKTVKPWIRILKNIGRYLATPEKNATIPRDILDMSAAQHLTHQPKLLQLTMSSMFEQSSPNSYLLGL
eukprot:g21834.t1